MNIKYWIVSFFHGFLALSVSELSDSMTMNQLVLGLDW